MFWNFINNLFLMSQTSLFEENRRQLPLSTYLIISFFLHSFNVFALFSYEYNVK